MQEDTQAVAPAPAEKKRWVSLVEQITEMLKAGGHPNPHQWKSHPAVLPAMAYTKDDGMQRFMINRQWQMILSDAPVSTLNERYCLVDDGTVEAWLKSFKDGVLPCILTHKLPIVKQ